MSIRIATTGLFLFAYVHFASADQVVVAGRNLPGVKIVGLEQGRLQFRSADGGLQTAWIDEVEFINVERGGAFVDLNDAERYVSRGDAENALIRYRRAARMTEDFWSELVETRLLRTCDRPALVDQAASSLVRVLKGTRSGPAAASRLIPVNVPEKRDAKVVQALEALDAALAKNPSEEDGAVLLLFRFSLLQRTGDTRAKLASKAIAKLRLPSALCCERAYSIQLAALRGALHEGADAEGRQNLDAFLRDCPEALLPGALILKGEVILAAASTRDELIQASWPFLRVAAHMPDHPLAADALFGAAQAVQRMGNQAKAMELLDECLAHQKLSAETRQRAEALLANPPAPNAP